MMIGRVVAILLLASVGSLLGCSAVIDDYDVVDCRHDTTPCDKLSLGLKGQCYRFECSADGHGCELRETDNKQDGILEEICDGLDNDCNDFIDEGTVPPDRGNQLDAPAGTDHVSHASVPHGTLVVTLTSSEPQNSAFDTVGFAVDDDGFGDLLPVGSDPDCSPSSAVVPCEISQIALAAAPSVLVGAGIQERGCDFGQLRVGSGSPSPIDLHFGEGNSGFGIDVEESCSVSSNDCRGASQPALALLGGVASEPLDGLLVWLAPAVAADSTCEAPNAFQLFARRLSFDGSGADAHLRAPIEGGSELLGASLAGGAPVIAATSAPESAGYFVAYPADDDVRVLFVARGFGDGVDSSAEASFGGRDVKSVAVAVDDDSTQGLALAVHAGSSNSSLELIALEASLGEAPHIEQRGSNVSIPVRGSVIAGPSLRYATSGFADPDTGRRPSGWLVVWVETGPDTGENHFLMGARVAADDLRLLGDPFELERGAISEPFTYLKHVGREDASSLQCGFLKDESVRLQQVSCE